MAPRMAVATSLEHFTPNPNVSIVVTNSNESLEPSPLTSPGLLLHGHDLQYLVLQGRSDEHVDNLVLFNWEREKVNFLQALDLPILHKTAKLGHRNPILLFLPPSTTPSTTSSSSSAPITKSSSETSTITTSGWSTVRHCSLVEVNQ